ncbi:uncharacterized protein LOC144994967 [Oryzias latipes]
MGNVRSLSIKLDELTALMRLQRVYRESSLLCFTETWLHQDMTNSVVSVTGFTLVRADRSAAQSGKKKGGGLAVFVNDRWCNRNHITVKEQHCSKDIELVAVSFRPYYLPREFSHVLVVTVYIPPSADAAVACERVHSTVSQLQTQHPQALILISGDFNHACTPLSATLSNFTQLWRGSSSAISALSAFNTIQPSLLRRKLEVAGVDQHLVAWTINYLTDRPQFVRLRDCVSDVVVCSTGAPQGTVLSPFLFTLYTSDFTYDSHHCHLQKFSDDSAIVGCVSGGDEQEYRGVITDFVSWCEVNHLLLNTSKTKELILDFKRSSPSQSPVNIQGSDIEVVDTFKYLGVHLNNRLDWSNNTDALYRRGQSGIHLLRRLRSFGVCRQLLRTFYDTVVASVVLYGVVCWAGGSAGRSLKRLNKLVRKAGSVLGCTLESIEEVADRRMLAKLTSIMDNPSHPLHQTVEALTSSFSTRLLHPQCKKERYRRSFLPTAIRLYNTVSK